MDCFSDKLNKIKNDLTGTKITVLGSAKSGIASARLAKRMGAKVFISEKYRITEHAMQVILKERFLFEEGGHTDRVFQADLIILSPGIPSNIPILIEAGKRQIPVISEIEFAFWFEQGRVVAITGSQGKSTTTTHNSYCGGERQRWIICFSTGNCGQSGKKGCKTRPEVSSSAL
jgi:UDP-N-acetylmuramoylalanine--D-glutamate ligase